jgi:hypothetical protein
MKHRLLNLLTALSLLLCVAAMVLWAVDFGPVHVGTSPQYAFDTDDRGNLEVCRWGAWCVRVPYWLLILGSAVGPVIRLENVRRRWQRFHPQPAALCPRCAYDLRATPGRCPECGREAAGVG